MFVINSKIFFSLTKVRLALSVVFSTLAGYILAADKILVLDMLLNINRKYNMSLVVVTHSLAIASKLEVCLELKSRRISMK